MTKTTRKRCKAKKHEIVLPNAIYRGARKLNANVDGRKTSYTERAQVNIQTAV